MSAKYVHDYMKGVPYGLINEVELTGVLETVFFPSAPWDHVCQKCGARIQSWRDAEYQVRDEYDDESYGARIFCEECGKDIERNHLEDEVIHDYPAYSD